MLFVAANDLLTMFVALEVFSLPLYLLCALARRRRLLSQEAALKYFLLGAFASAFFLFGVALIYGFAGRSTSRRSTPRSSAPASDVILLYAGLATARDRPAVQGGRGAVPRLDPGRLPGRADPGHRAHGGLHQGRRVRRAAAGAARRVRRARSGTSPRCIGAIAVLTMLVGAILAVTQTDIKRLLAYSSIANAGYLLVGVLAVGHDRQRPRQLDVLPGRLRLHGAGRVRRGHPGPRRRRRGDPPVPLGRAGAALAAVRRPVHVHPAGLRRYPADQRLHRKFAVFAAAVADGKVWLVIVGVVTSTILAFPYLRVVVMMWLSEPAENTPSRLFPGR